MRLHWQALPVFIPTLTAVLVGALPSAGGPTYDLTQRSAEEGLVQRDGHSHGGGHGHGGHHAAPLVQLNETEVLMYHQPTPPSYWTIDFVDVSPDVKRYPGLMGLHILFMSLAFFGALPIGIALRSVKHAWHGFSVILFYTLVVLGLSASSLYRKLTPDMYEGQKHSLQGYLVLLCASALSTLDLIALARRLYYYVKSIRAGEQSFTFKSCWNTVVLDREDEHISGNQAEYAGLVSEEPLELDAAELKARAIEESSPSQPIHVRRAQYVAPINTNTSPQLSEEDHEVENWANDVRHFPRSAASERTVFGGHSPRGSIHSDETLNVGGYPSSSKPKPSIWKKIGNGAFATAERTLVFAGLLQTISGIVVYTGGCRAEYINGCLAHLIKGGIFWCYGLATFARYLGAFSELGWAWNRAPSRSYPSAEFVECLVIFTYGITNTWMERFGAHPGDPYTTKQVQHISIAVMFWFAGLAGMGLESKTVRRWLASSSTAALSETVRTQEAVAEPPSYIGSFNPFPALCIGITGAAMSAHFQTYLFQVQIHMLWGYLLSGFAVMRCLTYFFLWLGPPRSILPSRPPTEALASFFLACGGLMFQFSTEEVTIAAMRQGHDDMMMFLNVAVAITFLAFTWTLFVVGFKGWLKSHTHAAMKFLSSA